MFLISIYLELLQPGKQGFVIFFCNSALNPSQKDIIVVILKVDKISTVIFNCDAYGVHCISVGKPATKTMRSLFKCNSLLVIHAHCYGQLTHFQSSSTFHDYKQQL